MQTLLNKQTALYFVYYFSALINVKSLARISPLFLVSFKESTARKRLDLSRDPDVPPFHPESDARLPSSLWSQSVDWRFATVTKPGFFNILGVFWCLGEDAAHSKLSSKNTGLRCGQLSKVVPKAVPIVWAVYATSDRQLHHRNA